MCLIENFIIIKEWEMDIGIRMRDGYWNDLFHNL